MKTWVERTKTAIKLFLKIARFSGVDSRGNCYYESRNIFTGTPKELRRWVIYAKGSGGVQVLPEWHGWLHYYMQIPPFKKKDESKSQKRGISRGVSKGRKQDTQRDNFLYEPWIPE